MGKQSRTKIQNPIAIPEPTNEVNALWRTCQALKEAIEVLQGERGNREAALKVDLEDLQDSIIGGAISVGSVTPGVVPTTLFKLEDTTLDTQVQGSFLYNQDGTQWYPSINALWKEGNQRFEFTLDTALTYFDLDVPSYLNGMVFEASYGTGGPPVGSDPDLGDVTFLLTAENSVDGAQTITSDIGGVTFTWENSLGVGPTNGEVRSAQAKFGNLSVWADGAVGANFWGWTGPLAVAGGPFDLGGDPFTLEAHVYLIRQNSDLDILSVWDSQLTRYGFQWAIDSTTRHKLTISTTGTNSVDFGSQQGAIDQMSMNQWYHVAVTRSATGDVQFWLDGNQVGTTQTGKTQTVFVPNTKLGLCCEMRGLSGNMGDTESYVDNVRITVGVNRYTTTFTPPAAPYDGTLFSKTLTFGDSGYPARLLGTEIAIANNAIAKPVYDATDISPMTFTDPSSIDRQVGYATMKKLEAGGSINATVSMWHSRVVFTAVGTLTFNNSDHQGVENGAYCWVISSSGGVTINASGMTITKFLGTTPTTGSATVAEGGWAIVVKDSDTTLHVLEGVGVS